MNNKFLSICKVSFKFSFIDLFIHPVLPIMFSHAVVISLKNLRCIGFTGFSCHFQGCQIFSYLDAMSSGSLAASILFYL